MGLDLPFKRKMACWALLAVLAADVPGAAAAALPPDPLPVVALSAGAAEIFDHDTFFCASIEWRPAFRVLRHLGPDFVVGTGRHGEMCAAVGVFCDIPIGSSLLLTPSFDAGYYNSADEGRDLGFDLEFRSAVQFCWRFDSGYRIGVTFDHLSNGSLADRNPGTEALTLTFVCPLCRGCPSSAP